MNITCKNVSYFVNDNDSTSKSLLNNVNVSFLQSTVTALMGPSGAGKSM
jgi:ABC-type multidrug transport system ATPase subunit